MHYGIEIVTLGDYADPRNVLRLAIAAETSGWEGLFIWDHLAFPWGVPSGDPWVTLSAVAASTAQLKIGTAITPAPDVSPQVLAQALTTLDILSQGRTIFGVGPGSLAQEYSTFSESTLPVNRISSTPSFRDRSARLDEGLDLLQRFWSGGKVTQKNSYFTVDGIILSPTPLQKPRIPIWIMGETPDALQRAARWDGWIVNGASPEGQMTKSPQDLTRKIAVLQQARLDMNRQSSFTPVFDIALLGHSTPYQGALTQEYETAGVTWWLERLHGLRGSFEDSLQRVLAGPPHV